MPPGYVENRRKTHLLYVSQENLICQSHKVYYPLFHNRPVVKPRYLLKIEYREELVHFWIDKGEKFLAIVEIMKREQILE